jgi:hypothetical protein
MSSSVTIEGSLVTRAIVDLGSRYVSLSQLKTFGDGGVNFCVGD